jgi:2-iminobutanoate/2-iminopropanoate deaminase
VTSLGERDNHVTKKAITSPDLPTPAGPYSHVIDTGQFVFTAGFGPQDPATGTVPDTIEAQTDQVINNVESALKAVGLTLADVVKTTVHLQYLDRDFKAFNGVYGSRFPAPYPVRTTVGSTLANILVEIDAVAVRSS